MPNCSAICQFVWPITEAGKTPSDQNSAMSEGDMYIGPNPDAISPCMANWNWRAGPAIHTNLRGHGRGSGLFRCRNTGRMQTTATVQLWVIGGAKKWARIGGDDRARLVGGATTGTTGSFYLSNNNKETCETEIAITGSCGYAYITPSLQ